MGFAKPEAVSVGTWVLLRADSGRSTSPLLIPAASPRREGGGCNDDRKLALLGPLEATLLLGLLGGSPGSPTGPVTDGTWLCCSCICDPDVWGSGAWIDGALVVVVLEEVGRPSAVTAGKGSVLRKVGKADVSDMSWVERSWVVV
jgi:hypothetical protein